MHNTTAKILVVNLLLQVLYLVLPAGISNNVIILFDFAVNISGFFIFSIMTNNPVFADRKNGLFIAVTTGSAILTILAMEFNLPALHFSVGNFLWIILVLNARKFANATARTIYKMFRKNTRVAIIGYNTATKELAERLDKKAKYSFEGFFDNYEPGFSINKPSKSIESIEYYLHLAKQKNINDLYIASSLQHGDEFEEFAQKAESHCIRINLIDVNESPKTEGYKLYHLSGMPVRRRYHEPLRRLRNKMLKRSFDICLSGFIIIFILSWLIPLVGLLIKLESKGSVFFKQLRSGRDNNAFYCYKFRSMKENAESDIMQASKNDQRITRIGAFLRKTSIDELPQFINVFNGDMSIAGPRPHMLLHTEEYSRQVNNYMVRLYLKPGITGWAQAKGYRGEITDIELMKKRVEHDIWYMEHWSIWLDIKILWLTFVSVVERKGNAY